MRVFVEPEVGAATRVAMGKVVGATGVKAVELLIARFAWAKVGRVAQMPFANERRGVARILEQRCHSGVIRRQAEHLVAMGAGNRLFCRTAQTVLPAARGQRKAGRRAHGRVGIAARKPHARACQGIKPWRDIGGIAVHIARAGTTQIGVAQVISQNKDQIGARIGHKKLDFKA